MEQVTVTIPDNVFAQDSGAIARALLECATLEAYRSELISIGRLAEILGFSIDEAHNFLKEHETPVNLDNEDIERGAAALHTLLSRQ
jgi:predicted HTH domain antitoxin